MCFTCDQSNVIPTLIEMKLGVLLLHIENMPFEKFSFKVGSTRCLDGWNGGLAF